MAEPIHASCTPQILTIHRSMILCPNWAACHACRQPEKLLKGPKRQKDFCGFADTADIDQCLGAKHVQNHWIERDNVLARNMCYIVSQNFIEISLYGRC